MKEAFLTFCRLTRPFGLWGYICLFIGVVFLIFSGIVCLLDKQLFNQIARNYFYGLIPLFLAIAFFILSFRKIMKQI